MRIILQNLLNMFAPNHHHSNSTASHDPAPTETKPVKEETENSEEVNQPPAKKPKKPYEMTPARLAAIEKARAVKAQNLAEKKRLKQLQDSSK